MSLMKTITICSSMMFYPEVLKIGKKLENMGWNVEYPESSLIMKQRNNFNPTTYKKTVTAKDKGKFIMNHFRKELNSNAILVVNKTKNGVRGYIGGNVLMEIGIAFQAKIKIYLLYSYPKSHQFFDELSAINPTVLHGKTYKLK